MRSGKLNPTQSSVRGFNISRTSRRKNETCTLYYRDKFYGDRTLHAESQAAFCLSRLELTNL